MSRRLAESMSRPFWSVFGGRARRRPKGSFMRRIFRSALAGGLASLFVLSSAGVALADNALGDGDGAVPLSTNVLDFGANVCVGSTVTKDVALGLVRNGNGTTTFANSASVSFSIQGITGSGLSA